MPADEFVQDVEIGDRERLTEHLVEVIEIDTAEWWQPERLGDVEGRLLAVLDKKVRLSGNNQGDVETLPFVAARTTVIVPAPHRTEQVGPDRGG